MNRAEALRRLEGTWTFDLTAGRVHVRDLALLRALEVERIEAAATRPSRAAPSQASPMWG